MLQITDGVVARRLDHLGEVEIHLRVRLARQHRETHRILADFVDDVGKRHEIARALRHLERLALLEPADHLPQLDVDTGLAVRPRGDPGLYTLSTSRLVGGYAGAWCRERGWTNA